MDNEIWVPLRYYTQQKCNLREWVGVYEISNLGRVRRCYDNKILKEKLDARGDGILVRLDAQSCKTINEKINPNRDVINVHVRRAVMSSFKGLPDRKTDIVVHKDDDFTNNRLDNLEWMDRSIYNSLIYKGAKNNTKVSMEVATQIREEYNTTGIRMNELSAKYNLAHSGISNILLNKAWHDPDFVNKRYHHYVSNQEFLEIIYRFDRGAHNGDNPENLAKEYNLTAGTIREMYEKFLDERGLTYKKDYKRFKE